MTRRTLQEIRSARAAHTTPEPELAIVTPQCECDGDCVETSCEDADE